MSRTAPDGGPAFPTDEYYDEKRTGTSDGMSLRDYFAAKALVGLLSAEAHPSASGALPASNNLAAFFALNAYAYADAMLKARETTGAATGVGRPE